jgi:hypothetical protein
MDILQLKMTKDLLKMTLDYAIEKNIEIDTEWIQSRIQIHMVEHKMSFPELGNGTSKHSMDRRCCARLWKDQTGKDQCTHEKVEGDYCEKHNRMLQLDGVLRFGDIREEKPKYDLIKFNKGIVETLHWIDSNPVQQLQNVLNQQARKVIISTPKLVLD